MTPLQIDPALRSFVADELLPGLDIYSPPPPGTEWNQPWYQPQCGATVANTNPANDSENNTYDPNDGGKLVPFTTSTPNFGPGTGP